jgi:pimeloyl-ACP methyl ester carboxylesterase
VTLAFREAGPADGRVALMVHGFPESSYMWEGVMPAVADAGWHAVAPDLAGFGDSPLDPPGTWERQVEALERFRRTLGIERCVLVVHDWGGLIGLRWACEHPDAIAGLVISSTGFFPDGKWHGMAQAMRTPEVGEQAIAGLDREGFGGLLRSTHAGFTDHELDEYFKGLADEARKRNALELYRSGDFAKLEGYRLADVDVPVLLIWGANDEFARIASAHRLEQELGDTELVVLEDAGHFVWDERPDACGAALATFLERLGPD